MNLMLYKPVRRLLRINLFNWRTFLSAIGMITGLLLLLHALQLYSDINQITGGDEQLIGEQYIILNKQPSLTRLLKRDRGIGEEDIEKLKQLSGVQDVGAFYSSNFAVSAYTDFQNLSNYSTELFMEAVPERFLDIRPDKWSWKNPGDAVPFIVPRDFLVLYNMGFAPSRGLPRISESLLGNISFKLVLSGNGQCREFDALLAGWSKRLGTILVPAEFLQWAAGEFAKSGKPAVNRLIIKAVNPGDIALLTELQALGFEVDENSSRLGQLGAILKISVGAIGFLGLVIILLAITLTSLTLRLMIAGATQNIKTLLLLGYSPAMIERQYYRFLSWLFGGVTVTTVLIGIISRIVISNLFEAYGFSLSGIFSPAAVGCALLSVVIAIVISVVATKRDIRDAGMK
ncbi:MAG: hypothetical protein K8S56_07050 [Candidatus Cloacimonetes bacterium]|nr:hypothetical protein [Candidatus Cloacimonadota bacterium]